MNRRQFWTAYEFEYLAVYNAEVARGIMHTPEWQQRMAEVQRRFDEQRRAELIDDGFTDLGNGSWLKTTTHRPRWFERPKP